MATILQQLSNGMADLVEASAESVLRVEARRRLPASGIVWSEDLIVCAQHAVEFEEDISAIRVLIWRFCESMRR